ncbi:MAG: PEP-CTERM sorting domain-containing protein [Rubrivivax sp.]
MRKSILGALISSAFAVAGPAHAGLILDLDGAGGLAPVEVTALDWSQTSFLAQNGNQAIANFNAGSGSTEFQVYTHAKLTGYTLAGTNSSISLPSGFGEITMVASYTERVVSSDPTGAANGGNPTAGFRSTGAGWLEFYYDPTPNASDLTGSGFNDGVLIGRLSGVAANVFGNFTVDSLAPLSVLDGFGADQYAGQQTVTGSGSQGKLQVGTSGVSLDAAFFITTLTGFFLDYQNISIGLPFGTTDPSDCFNTTQNGGALGTSSASTCDASHQAANYAGQVNGSGYTPNVGPVNGLGLGSPDFVAQTDFNSAVNGVPEPGTLALVGLALGTAGFAASRRRRS